MALPPSNQNGAVTPNPRVRPAHVNFLTIYNPLLGDTDETEQDQIVFWCDKHELDGHRTGRKGSRTPDQRSEEQNGDRKTRGDTAEQSQNDRLRQIGLARGMTDFARNFSHDKPLETIETDRSRIILIELEKDWWILASIDLTRLPIAVSQAKNSDDTAKGEQSQYEYSAREVGPAILLRTQLLKAHNLFLLHHSANLWDLYDKIGRYKFCSLLHRFWESFARNWDVLLHGSPAIDVYGDCTKLAGGGELGVGVGEEEWGSGEREVLEGFVERAEGLIDCIVGRYGSAPIEKSKSKVENEKRKKPSVEEKTKLGTEADLHPWLGSGDDPGPADGVVFSGVGVISRRSLASVSQWMEAIFKHGDMAYGVGENPASRPRQKRKRPKLHRQVSDGPFDASKSEEPQGPEPHPRLQSPRKKAPDLRRKAIENNATPPRLPPGIPPPLVGAVERSLDEALAKVAERSNSKSPKPSPKREGSGGEATKGSSDAQDDSSVFSMDSMKNIFTLGYGSSWTLNPGGFEKNKDNKTQTSKSQEDKPDTSKSTIAQTDQPPSNRSVSSSSRPAEERLQEIDPTPEVSDEDLPFVQRLEQSIGKFIIGLSGDLENAEFDESDEAVSLSENSRGQRSQRIFLRTLTVQLANTLYQRPGLNKTDRKLSQSSNLSKGSTRSSGSTKSYNGQEPKTSAAASVDGANPTKRYEKVQVAVYVHQPFIFVFLFELHTPKLTMPGFYRTIHHQLGPLQKPLLQRTDPTRATARIAAALNEKAGATVSAVKKQVDSHGNAIYDLIYDPSKNTIRTSIPNIPIPSAPDTTVKTSSTISGAWYTLGIPIGTSNSPSTARLDPTTVKGKLEPWTRVEALNVHTQILNTFAATRNPKELERTVKTARGWWVLWMKVGTPGKESEELKDAFLVRKSGDYTSSSARGKDGSGSRSASGSPGGRWLLRDQGREVSGSSGFGPGMSAGAKGVSEGVGVDARKWVEGLLSLTQ